jgi:hypothetical protein
VDFECEWCGRLVVGLLPAFLGVDDGEVDELSGGLLGWEVSSGFDRFADLSVERLDRVGIPYERRWMPAVTQDRLDACWCPGW